VKNEVQVDVLGGTTCRFGYDRSYVKAAEDLPVRLPSPAFSPNHRGKKKV
jgi:hypothetical protein